ncbi:MAG: efflux RND transporter periplasmic adaptor subunit [Bdellovibrionota bacterium]
MNSLPAKFGILLTAFLLIACSKKEAEGPTFLKLDEASVVIKGLDRIKTEKLSFGDLAQGIDLPGKISIPDKDLMVVSARVQGRLEVVSPTTGDSVKRGDVVATIWSPDLTVAVEELDMAKKQNNPELLALTREKLTAMGLSPGDATSGRTAYPIRAPISGAVLERKLNSGSAVQPGDPILTIGRTDVQEFLGEVPPEQAKDIRTGMTVAFDDAPNLKAQVANVSAVADPSSKLVKVRCKFLSLPDRNLPQETLLNARIVTKSSQALLLPAKALIYSNNTDQVFVKKGDEARGAVFVRRPVKVLSRSKKYISVEIEGEVKEGAEVVSEGALLLNDMLEGEG